MNQQSGTPSLNASNPVHPGRDALTRAAGVVGSATLLSRILGYLRDVIIAGVFGTGLASDAFFLAYSIPNLLRRLFAEGSLGAAFVPVFSQHLTRDGFRQAAGLANSALRVATLVLIAGCGLGIIFAPQFIHLFAYGWVDQPDKLALCVKLMRLMLPYGLFICLVAVCMGILNVLGHFAAPALAPAILNIAMIAAVFCGFLVTRSEIGLVQWLAMGVCIGGALQLLLQIPFLQGKGIALFGRWPLWHPGIKQVLKLFGPVLFGSAVYQINSLVIRLFASMLPQGSVSYLYYADRLVQFPLGVFGMAAATAVLPALSRQAAEQQWQAFGRTFNAAIRLVLFMTLPSMVGLIVLREPIVALLFQRGAFNMESMRLTAGAVLYYGVGLWAFSAVRIVLNTFYALQETWIPVRIGCIAIAVNILLCSILMGPMRHNGLALALTLSSMVNMILLTVALRKRLGPLGWREMAASIWHSLACALAMGTAVWWLARLLLESPAQCSPLRLFAGVAICTVGGSLLYAGLARVFQLPEMDLVLQLLIRKKYKR